GVGPAHRVHQALARGEVALDELRVEAAGPLARADERDHVVPALPQPRDEPAADEPGAPGDERAHGETLLAPCSPMGAREPLPEWSQRKRHTCVTAPCQLRDDSSTGAAPAPGVT